MKKLILSLTLLGLLATPLLAQAPGCTRCCTCCREGTGTAQKG